MIFSKCWQCRYINMVKTRKQIAFDLDMKALEMKNNSWLNLCMRDCREANVGKEHSKNYVFDKKADVPVRKINNYL